MEDDEGNLSNRNEPSESETKEEKPEISDSGNTGESSLNASGRSSSLEAVAAGGKIYAFGDFQVDESLISMEVGTKMVEPPPAASVEAVTEEGVIEMIPAYIKDPLIKTDAEEGSKSVADDKGTISVTDTGDATVFSAWQIDAREDEMWAEPKLGIEASEEFMSVVDTNLEAVVSNVDKDLPFSELPASEKGDGFLASGEVVRSPDYEAKKEKEKEREICEEMKIEDTKVEKVDFVCDRKMETDLKKVIVCGDGEEKVDSAANYSGIEAPDTFLDIAEEKSDHAISKEILTSSTQEEIEKNLIMNISVIEDEPAHTDGMGYSCADVKDNLVENNVVFAQESSIAETKKVEVYTSMEDSNDFKLDNSINVKENQGEAVVDDQLLDGNTKEEGLEPNMIRNYVEEKVEFEDAEVKMGTECEVVAGKNSGEDTIMETDETDSIEKDADQNMDDSCADPQDEIDEKISAGEMTETQDTEIEAETEMAESGKVSVGRRKRGRVSKNPSISKASTKASSRKTVGEDVCFICFDGGELVLCDRRGCPKAYHPSCVNRDEAFFRAKGRWNCGWHMCSICEKNSFFMCYTCTFSLCKSCSKDAVIFCVRGNKGFCEICMRTIKLIENNEHGNKDNPVDFDDKGSWEYLFKDYYIELKSKLSLSSVEVAEARRPSKGASLITDPCKQESFEAQPETNDEGSCSDNSIDSLNFIKPKRRKLRKQTKSLIKEKKLVSEHIATGEKNHSADNSEWASKELLEFVSHMKNGDVSILSQFDVQGLLIEYIKRNKLRDPRRKSQIICDARLAVLFGKPRVGHFEMLKLLESHFIVKDEQNDDVQESIVDMENNQLDVDDDADHVRKGIKDKKRKSRKKGMRAPQSNLDDYAAIDMHNISLIYLRRKLMEDLLEDVENFHEKVVGMFVRIRISGSLQKHDLYRLVQVVGTSKVAEPYKIGKKTTDIMMEILNLDKTEVISVDTISNQEFNEEECKRLRQSIKCGLISRLTVGEILDKTMEIHSARVNDWMESEIVRLSHLRDRASDIGRRKELRECVEKLQILKTPEERQRRLQEIPEIHSDPKMDPSYESDESGHHTEENTRDNFIRSRSSGFTRRSSSIYPEGDNPVKDSWASPGKAPSKNWEFSRNTSGSNFYAHSTPRGEIAGEIRESRGPQESTNLGLSAAKSEYGDKGVGAASRAELLSVPSITSQSSIPSEVVEASVKINETEKVWHYQDPSGKVQGPFSMVQLRKWSNTGYFPTDLKVWRASEKQENSILISDALAGKFPKELPAHNNTFPAADTLNSTPVLSGHSGNTSGTFLQRDRERPNANETPLYKTKFSSERLTGNASISIPSPSPRRSNAGWIGGEGALPNESMELVGNKGVNSSPIVVSPDTETHSLAPRASALHSLLQSSTPVSPTPKSQQGIPMISADSLHFQPPVTSEPHVQMHGDPSTIVQPVQHVVNQNPLVETQHWANSAQPVLPQGYGWGAPNTQNPAASTPQAEYWRSIQGGQPSIYPPAAPNMNWGATPAENHTPLGMRHENPNTGWGVMHAIPNMGMVNPVPGNADMNRGPPMPAQPRGISNPSWLAPPPPPHGNMVPNNATPGWVAPPLQGPIHGNDWGPMTGNVRAAPTHTQGPAQGTTNWGAPQGNQGGSWAGQQEPSRAPFSSSWPGHQEPSRAPFSGQMNAPGQDSGSHSGRKWNNQPFGGGRSEGHRPFIRRQTPCPYNVDGRKCKKGAYCDYLHV